MTLRIDFDDRGSGRGAKAAFGSFWPRGRRIGAQRSAKGIHSRGDLRVGVQPHAYINRAYIGEFSSPGIFSQFHDAAGPFAGTTAQHNHQQKT